MNGYYCELELAPTEEVKAVQFRSGDKFSFLETPWLTHTVNQPMSDRIVYTAECGTTRVINNLDRIVELR